MARTIVISGAASGIGLATAERFARQKANLVLIDIDQAALGKAEERLAEFGATIELSVADVTSADQIGGCVDAARSRFGAMDTLVAAAGVAMAGPFLDMSENHYRKIMDVNFMGTLNIARKGIPALIESGGGSFVAIASDAALRGVPGYAAYCASKHAVLGLVKSLALEFSRQNVRSNAVCPGFVETPMADALLADYSEVARKRLRNGNPIGRYARPEEIAAVIDHLSSPEQSYVNGMSYSIDGGSTAGPFNPPETD